MTLPSDDGDRILLQDATGTRLFLGNLAERQSAAGVTTVKRSYTLGATSVAVRTKIGAGTDSVEYLLGDVRGSSALSVVAGAGGAVNQQWYTPYGATRGTTTITATTRGYIGQHKDTTTGLNYLNNRYQDPQLGVFISVDPLVAVRGRRMATRSNPVTFSCWRPDSLRTRGTGSASRSATAAEYGFVEGAGALESTLELCRHQFSDCAREVGGNSRHPLGPAVGSYADLLLRGVRSLGENGDLESPVDGAVFGVGVKLVGDQGPAWLSNARHEFWPLFSWRRLSDSTGLARQTLTSLLPFGADKAGSEVKDTCLILSQGGTANRTIR